MKGKLQRFIFVFRQKIKHEKDFHYENQKKSYYNSVHLKVIKYLRFMKMQEYLQKIWNIDLNSKKCLMMSKQVK